MIQDVEKTIPSEDISIAWLAGIIDGEGSIGIYKNSKRPKGLGQLRITVVNTDIKILDKVGEIFDKLNIFYSRYVKHINPNFIGFKSYKECQAIAVSRRDDFERALKIIGPFLVGYKKIRAEEILSILEQNPRKMKPVYRCCFCKKIILGRKRKYCSLKCWHDYSRGEQNPNFRHGKYIACRD